MRVRSMMAIVIALFLTALLAACSGAAPATTTAPTEAATLVAGTPPPSAVGSVTETNVIQYEPPAPTDPAREGECFSGSLSIPRPEAWRCMAGNQILDPCFGGDNGESVVCGAYPALDTPSFTLNLTSPLPTPNPPAAESAQAWVVELADGTICDFGTGATTGIGDKRLNYLCSSDNRDMAVGLLGDLQPGTVWTAEKATIEIGKDGPVLKDSEMVELRTVWQ